MVTQQNWFELKITAIPEIEDLISGVLFENGASGWFQQADYLIAYFPEKECSSAKLESIKNLLNKLITSHFNETEFEFNVRVIKDKDWNEEWKKSIEPLWILPDLVISPTWKEIQVSDSTLLIHIDPQMAFGTGHHATTQIMIKLLKKFSTGRGNILDIGTGSGILAIIAAKLNSGKIVAFDIDPLATTTARQNAIINSVQEKILFFTGTMRCLVDSAYDIILANINRTEILQLIPEIEYLAGKGVIILSGILIEEECLILEALTNLNFNILEKMQQDEWLGLVVTKKND